MIYWELIFTSGIKNERGGRPWKEEDDFEQFYFEQGVSNAEMFFFSNKS